MIKNLAYTGKIYFVIGEKRTVGDIGDESLSCRIVENDADVKEYINDAVSGTADLVGCEDFTYDVNNPDSDICIWTIYTDMFTYDLEDDVFDIELAQHDYSAVKCEYTIAMCSKEVADKLGIEDVIGRKIDCYIDGNNAEDIEIDYV